MCFSSLISFNNSISSFVKSSLLFKIKITKSDSFIIFLLFSTPIFSTILSVSLIPAVSVIFKTIPFNFIVPSTISLVVPSISVTMAFSSSNKLFNKLLFPTLGLPIIPTFIPWLISFPSSDFFIIFNNSSLKDSREGNIFSFVNTSISSYSG